jgi:hypothetical protein
MIYLNFKKWDKESKPSFKNKETSTNKITWQLKWIYYNEQKDITTKEWKQVTIPANINVVLDDTAVNFSITSWNIFRSVMNSLLSAEIDWEPVEFYTYINKAWYKTVSVTNPADKKKIQYDWKEITVNNSYAWFYKKEEIPEVEVIKNKKWEFVSADDWDANQFFIDKIKEKFGRKNEEQIKEEEINIEDIPF